MKQEDVDVWIAALRSGDYEQGHGSLRKEDDQGESKFCCLGVALDLLSNEEWSKDTDARGRYSFDGHVLLPTCKTLESIGLDGGLASELADMNDGGASFIDIADWISENRSKFINDEIHNTSSKRESR